MTISPSSVKRFWDKFERGLGCWNWLGTKDEDGYGVLTNRPYGMLKAHRLSHELLVEPITGGLWVLHSCDNPSCVRPSHLHLGTAKDNGREKAERGRGATGAKNGSKTHPESVLRGCANGRAKLTDEIVKDIRRLAAQTSCKKLAAMFGVGSSTIHSVVSRQTWKHIQ